MHSQDDARENDESHDRALKRVTEKATKVVARLQCVKHVTVNLAGWCIPLHIPDVHQNVPKK